MDDYKRDQDRFFDSLRELADYREALSRKQLDEIRKRIDAFVKVAVGHMFDSVEEGRAWSVERLKEKGKVPSDFTYPDADS
jgi:hypothetical protein